MPDEGTTRAGVPSVGDLAPRDDELEPDLDALWASCSRFLSWHGYRGPSDLLEAIPSDAALDRYGEGGVVAELESEVARLLGKPSAAFLVSGTMAQQIALRVHADRRGRRTVVFHPMCHLDSHEGRGYERLHGLAGRPVGEPTRLLSREDLDAVAEPVAALLLELPQRDIGGQLPTWDELVSQAGWAHDSGAALHMDGARLWGCEPFYGRTLAEICEPFDTVYVSLYKQIGGLAGCCLAGDEDAVAEVREWRTRHGGTLFAMWPYAASDLAALRLRLPRMPDYFDHALAIADAVRGAAGVEVVPDPPHTPTMSFLLHTTPERFSEESLRLATDEGVWTWARAQPTASPTVVRVELETGDATLGWKPDEVRDVLERLAAP